MDHFSSDRPAPDALGMSASLRSRPNLRTAAIRRGVPTADYRTAAKIASLDHRRLPRAAWAAVRHHKHNLPQHLGKLTIRVAINRNAEALHDAANLAK
jgi:hypothetical protein